MRKTTDSHVQPAAGSQTFTFGPFAIGDVWESVYLSFFLVSPSGPPVRVTVRAGSGGSKTDPDFRQSAQYTLPSVVASQFFDVRFPVWQKIESQCNYLTVEVACTGALADFDLTCGVTVRPAFKIPGFRSKVGSKAGNSLISD